MQPGVMPSGMPGQVPQQGPVPTPQHLQANGAMQPNWQTQQPNVQQMGTQQPGADAAVRRPMEGQGGVPSAAMNANVLVNNAVRQVETMKMQFMKSQQQSESSFVWLLVASIIDESFPLDARSLKEVHVPEQQLVEYRNTFSQLDNLARDLERKLPIVASFVTEDELKRMVTLV